MSDYPLGAKYDPRAPYNEELVTKEIPIFRTITVTDKSTIDKPLYGTVCYKSTKTRSVIDKGTTKTKWSYKNNMSLINDGWVMTGKKKRV